MVGEDNLIGLEDGTDVVVAAFASRCNCLCVCVFVCIYRSRFSLHLLFPCGRRNGARRSGAEAGKVIGERVRL